MANDMNDSRTAVPSVRSTAGYPFEPGALTGLKPLPGFAGCLALVPTGPGQLQVALFVAAAAHGGVAWSPPRGTRIMDVPAGFDIDDGDAILRCLKQSDVDGKPGPPGTITTPNSAAR
jgi:hypothetical protein